MNRPSIQEQVRKYIASDPGFPTDAPSTDFPDFGSEAFITEYLRQSGERESKTMKMFAIFNGDNPVEAFACLVDRHTISSKHAYMSYPLFTSRTDAQEAADDFVENDRACCSLGKNLKYTVKEVEVEVTECGGNKQIKN